LSLSLLAPPAGLSPPCRRRPWWLTVGGREVWLLLVLGSIVCSFSPANKKVGRSGSGDAFSLVLQSLILGTEKSIGGSHATTLLPRPWRDLFLAGLALVFPTPSCCNKMPRWCYLEALVDLGMLLRCRAVWRVRPWGTFAGIDASPPCSMAEGRPSTRSPTSSGGPLLHSVGARRGYTPKWFVPGGVDMAVAGSSSSDWRAPRATSSLTLKSCASRSPATGGEGDRAPDCFSRFLARVLSVKCNVFSSNFRFFRARDVKGHCCNSCTHRFN
jgi:hypothetical protein